MNRSIWAGENIHGNSKTDIMRSFTIYIYKHPCGGANRTVFSTLKITIPCASPRKLCVILGSKNYPKSASVSPKKTCYHSFRTLSRSTALSTLISSLAFSIAWHSRSQHAVPAVLCWSLLILPFFLVWMPGGSLSLIFFHVRSIPSVCTLKDGFGPLRFKRTNSPAAWFTSSCFNWYVFNKEGYAFAPSVTK